LIDENPIDIRAQGVLIHRVAPYRSGYQLDQIEVEENGSGACLKAWRCYPL